MTEVSRRERISKAQSAFFQLREIADGTTAPPRRRRTQTIDRLCQTVDRFFEELEAEERQAAKPPLSRSRAEELVECLVLAVRDGQDEKARRLKKAVLHWMAGPEAAAMPKPQMAPPLADGTGAVPHLY